jgi:hypothetical protein
MLTELDHFLSGDAFEAVSRLTTLEGGYDLLSVLNDGSPAHLALCPQGVCLVLRDASANELQVWRKRGLGDGLLIGMTVAT